MFETAKEFQILDTFQVCTDAKTGTSPLDARNATEDGKQGSGSSSVGGGGS